jgi:hypothetical protein
MAMSVTNITEFGIPIQAAHPKIQFLINFNVTGMRASRTQRLHPPPGAHQPRNSACTAS